MIFLSVLSFSKKSLFRWDFFNIIHWNIIQILLNVKNNQAMLTTLCHAFISIDTQFRMSILERLEQMEQRMAEITNQNPSSESMATKGGGMEGGGATDQQSQVIQKKSYLYVWKFPFQLMSSAGSNYIIKFKKIHFNGVFIPRNSIKRHDDAITL